MLKHLPLKRNLGMSTKETNAVVDLPESSSGAWPRLKSIKLKKAAAMYCTMVAVSTCAIFCLEHASLINAFRTALVAAVGKTLAANWVSGLFD